MGKAEIAAGAIRAQARVSGDRPEFLTGDEVYGIWDEIARTNPDTTAGRFYHKATKGQVNRVIGLVRRGH